MEIDISEVRQRVLTYGVSVSPETDRPATGGITSAFTLNDVSAQQGDRDIFRGIELSGSKESGIGKENGDTPLPLGVSNEEGSGLQVK